METYKIRTPKDIWETALGELQVQLSKPNYHTWFSKTTGIKFEDKQFVIGVPNTFAAEYLDKNQRSLIERALKGLTCPEVQVIFQVNGRSDRPAERVKSPDLPGIEPTFIKLNPNYVFESFVEGNANRLARAAAVSVSQNPGRSYNPLYIHGGVGLGKTHLLHAIGQSTARKNINVICTSAEQFTNEFIAAIREKTTDEFRNKYRNIGMLLIDDIQFIGGKEQTEESFFHTFNELHNTNRQIVITSDCSPKSMPLLEERLRSRFEWGLIVDLQPPDYEMRLAILRSKSRSMGVELPDDVLELIAGQNVTNIRTLEGSLNRVLAYARLLRVTPTVETAKHALQDIAKKEYTAEAITPYSIIEAVAESFNLTAGDIVGRKRDKDTSLARRLAMYLIRQETNSSLVQTGQEIGNRDAASVTLACKKISTDINNSAYLKRKVQEVQKVIHSLSGIKKTSKTGPDRSCS